MAVSLRMDALLERELELAAKRQGVTKSQFIVDAVERALGRKDPFQLLLQVQKEYGLGGSPPRKRAAMPKKHSSKSTGEGVREVLRAKQAASMRDWLAFQKAKKSGKAWSPDDAAA